MTETDRLDTVAGSANLGESLAVTSLFGIFLLFIEAQLYTTA